MPSLGSTVAFAALVFLTGPAAAQEWPIRPVTMVVPFAAGSQPDQVGRYFAPHLSERLGQQVIVENVSGGGGMVGAHRVAKAAPDGYQFVYGNGGTHAMAQALHTKPLYNAETDFAPVALMIAAPSGLRSTQRGDWNQCDPCSLSRRRAGDAGSDR